MSMISSRSQTTHAPRHAFVVGAARSGTTILQAALNSSPDIFLFGEANFYLDPGTADFRQRYNAMHASYGNQETKGTYCPNLLGEQGSCYNYLKRLSETYRYSGDKLAFAEPFGHSTDAFMEFQARHFYEARYVFTFRHPVDCLASVARKFAPAALEPFARSYLRVVLLYLRMLRTFPFVTAMVMEDADRQTFERLARFLDADLDRAYGYYVRPAGAAPVDPSSLPISQGLIADMRPLFERLRAATPADGLPVHLEQKLSPSAAARQSPLGRIYTDAAALIAGLPLGRAATGSERRP